MEYLPIMKMSAMKAGTVMVDRVRMLGLGRCGRRGGNLLRRRRRMMTERRENRRNVRNM